MIYFERIKDYAPFAKHSNGVYFGFTKQNQLFGQVIDETKIAYVCKIICLKPENISYRRSFMKLCPAKLIPILGQCGFPKAEYVFAVERVDSIPSDLEVVDQKLYDEILTSKIELPPLPKNQKNNSNNV